MSFSLSSYLKHTAKAATTIPNIARKNNKKIAVGEGGIINYPIYEDPAKIANWNPSAEAIEAAEWCAKYDCSSISNPEGVPMTEHVTGQAGFHQCPGDSKR